MKIKRRVERALIEKLLPIPVQKQHAEYSVIYGDETTATGSTQRLIDLALEAIRHAQKVTFEGLKGNRRSSMDHLHVWPGEHYRILAGLVMTLKPKSVIEIGTGGGTGALAIKEALLPDARIVTFDITPWESHPDSILQEQDFSDGRLIQRVDDVSQPDTFSKHQELFENADFIMVDAAKDGLMEQRLLDLFETVSFNKKPIMFFDDIRVWNMLKIWKDIRKPKLDLTSFGHWTGTGLVDWT